MENKYNATNCIEELDNFDLVAPDDWTPINSMIKVVGVGGGGCNAVSYMNSIGFSGCQFIACNTDQKALDKNNVPNKLRIGSGLGAGTRPEIARNAAMDAYGEITKTLIDGNTRMVFVMATLGGGTGTGAAPIVSSICKEAGVLTVGVVTLPFATEGKMARMKALDGLDAMRNNVDSLIVIDNNKLYSHYGKLSICAAFHKVDEVLATAVSGIIDIIEKTGYINVDLNDVQTMMRDSGMALMGCGSGNGENRVEDAVKGAIESPLLNNYDLKKATKVLVNVTCSDGDDGLTMDELEKLEDAIDKYLGITDNYKKGIVFSDDPEYGDKITVTIIATGVNMMGAVPEDYYSDGRGERQNVEEESSPTVVSPTIEPDPVLEEETEDSEVTESSSEPVISETSHNRPFIRKVIGKIQDEVIKLYDEMDTEI